ncbi:unnamed protein product [Phaedon cochleariae]|uniref:Folliculin-interacting protein n=1 Tax=Phaedon cochleariae TaxID=80249 RepID=A0A9N9S9U8_PHACE|nr:unnamed protein product [Phaedon cochleariae]
MAHVSGGESINSTDSKEKLGTCGNCHYTELTPSQRIRIVLFRECRFKERQLLFDSLSTPNQSKNIKYTDRSESNDDNVGKIGPLIRRNSEEFSHLTDLIFGSTALKYHETYYKIHSISSPQRMIFTQVFIPQRRRSLKKCSGLSLSKSGLLELQNSFSSPKLPSTQSEISSYDSFSIFRRDSKPTPNSTSTTMDSGFSELSLASSSSSRFFENSSRRNSYEPSDTSLDFHNSSKDFCVGYSKLGLALIVAVGTDNDTYKDKYMQNITFIESILTRLRQYVEIALSTPSYFISVLIDISKDTALWLIDFANDIHSWTTKAEKNKCDKKCNCRNSSVEIFNKSWSILKFPMNIFFKKEINEEFVSFCKVINDFDVKETNFFLSTLLTSVLMHHTGWVATCFAAQSTKLKLNSSYHAVWMQLTNLQGSTGYLTKTTRTVVYGLKSENVIKRLLNFLRYFIRYFRVQRRYVERDNIDEENKLVDEICEREKNMRDNEQPIIRDNNSGMRKSKAFRMDLSKIVSSEEETKLDIETEDVKKSVLFILGEDEELMNLKKTPRKLSSEHKKISNNKSVENIDRCTEQSKTLKITKFPLPKVKFSEDYLDMMPFEFTFQDSSLDKFSPELMLQGTEMPEEKWKPILKTDLTNTNRETVDESVAILANTDKWKLQVWSSKREKFTCGHGDHLDSSPLVENMLEVILQMWKSNLSKQYCETFMEQRLLEICLKASTLAQFLLSTDFCSMDLIESTLNLNVLDVPLLMCVGSSIYPEVTRKYGISYQ